MNDELRRVAFVAVLLLVTLIVATTYWQVWESSALSARQDNTILRVAEFQVKRGRIVDNGRLAARSMPKRLEGKTLFFRTYPLGGLTAHLIGYSTAGRSRVGLERSLNDKLTGTNRSLSSLLDEAKGRPIQGNHVYTTLRLDAQRAALRALGTRCGAVAAIDPRSGRLLVLASSPTYNPNLVERKYELIGKIRADCEPASPLLNRATQGLYPPGSTFKVVTMAAALESKRWTPESEFDDPGYCIAYGKRVNNFDTTRPFGRISLVTALQYSVNSVFCNIGQELGAKRILNQAKRFGFYASPPLETPIDERQPSGLYDSRRRLLFPKRDSDVDAGRTAFGQERLLVTPLQMAMVAGAIANGGVLMEPFAVNRVVSPKGKTIQKTRPRKLPRAVSPTTARDISEMMVKAVEKGTGTSARIPGLRVGGKTGTAETGLDGSNVTWFIAFAGPAGQRPRVAIAVVLQNQQLTGGATAAPIAREVLQALLPTATNT
ncbi:MAG: penicillin-binding protein 2 [Actinobacteria bacterium]|nr:penicillin-binding protein 2 [Actinomycetota bacterium]